MAHILESSALKWSRGSQADRLGIDALLLRGGGCVRLSALEADYKFLLAGDVFTRNVINTWLTYKCEREVDPMGLRPHPYEFAL